MTVTSVDKDTEKLTMTVTTELAASVDRVWQMWEDPRLLEKWWGPPTYPATFERHEFTEGGVVTYHMTGPEGEKYPGRWNVQNVGKPTLLEFEDAFADDDGNVNPDMPVSNIRVDIAESGTDGRTTMTILTAFPSKEAMEKLLEMGMDEGMTLAVNQIDALL